MELTTTCILVEHVFPFLDRATYDNCRLLNKDILQLSNQVSNPVWPSHGSLHLHHEIACIAVADHVLAVGCETGEVILVVRKTMQRFLLLNNQQEQQQQQGHTMAIVSIQFSPDEMLLATGSVDGFIRLWQLRDHDASGRGQALWERQLPPGSLTLPLTSHGRKIPPSSSTTTTSTTGSLLQNLDCPSILLPNHHYKPVHSLVFDHTSQHLISAAGDEPTMFVWNTKAGLCEHHLQDRWEYPTCLSMGLAAPNDGPCLAMYGSHGSLHLYTSNDLSSSSSSTCSSTSNNKKKNRGIGGTCGRILDGGFPQLSEIQFSKDGQFLYGRSGQQIQKWDVTTGKRSALQVVKEQQTIVAATLSPRCDMVAQVTRDGRLVTSTISQHPHSNDPHRHPLSSISTPMTTTFAYPGQYRVAFTCDGRSIITANCRPGILEFWGVSL